MGDEGKGRLIHEIVRDVLELDGRDDAVGMVMKVNGGANAGHTTAQGLKLNLLPCGVPEPEVELLGIGAGVVADPRKIWWEMRPLEFENRFEIFNRLLIDERCMVSDLNHRLLDLASEHYRSEVRGGEARGTTGRGITPAYMDETGQGQIFYSSFLGEKDRFAAALRERTEKAMAMIEHVYRVDPESWVGFFDRLTEAETRANLEAVTQRVFDRGEFDFHPFRDPDTPFRLDFDHLVDVYWAAGSALAPAIRDIRETVLNILDADRAVIAEFGQAYWLDKRFGFSPNLTASHTFCPEFFQSAGIPMRPMHNVGVCKAYDTKVGTHLFLTQIDDGHPLGDRLKQLEYGTSTGRQRKVGWYDAVEKGDALRYGGCQDIMINKLDVLGTGDDWSDQLKICTGYRTPDGEVIHTVPRDDALRGRLKPVYIELPSWEEDLTTCRSWNDLPKNAQVYVATLLKATADVANHFGESPVPLPQLRYLGVGPRGNQIVRDAPPIEELLACAVNA